MQRVTVFLWGFLKSFYSFIRYLYLLFTSSHRHLCCEMCFELNIKCTNWGRKGTEIGVVHSTMPHAHNCKGSAFYSVQCKN
ncbi:hypothetical protein GDO81_026375 [Engystomops pustulosus]|uniref:Secreted protein n=1 Tax=Engystomops pustulosus TaxID=76066 RepID=A0AAV6YK14_ENGPU|nr:hypothetical protein GDO81_026375 [Engystomops pustulosus]